MAGGWRLKTENFTENRDGVICVVLALAALMGIWARTLLITGIPVTSVFSSIFTRMGFTLKYPFSVQTIPNVGESLGLTAWLSEAGTAICPHIGRDASFICSLGSPEPVVCDRPVVCAEAPGNIRTIPQVLFLDFASIYRRESFKSIDADPGRRQLF